MTLIKYRDIPEDKINLKSTRIDLNPYIPEIKDRPICSIKDCNNHVEIISTLKDGRPNFRKVCTFHRIEKIKKDNNVNNIFEITAKRLGFNNVREYLNSKHSYRQYRGSECENHKYNLIPGYKCTTNIKYLDQLQVHHWDCNHNNNNPENLITLCADCHIVIHRMIKDGIILEKKKP